ncbi:MAG: neutral/alkaline non-lysosomal ceramidase N-terminal domain-containing protein [Thermoproteota archaeon]|nr:neutral/alkaline non-lysosomal ceramidase N-terminal domain-containing protein [Candidatus Brockarchaeota archaeon]
MLRVGSSKVDITPAKQQFIAGFGQNRRSTGIHDNLYVRTLALELNGNLLFISSLDLIGLFRDVVMEIREKVKNKLNVKKERIIVACTHNHQGPDTLGLWGPSNYETGVDPSYMNYLIEQVVSSILEAQSFMKPATVRAGRVFINPKSILYNARDANLIDRQLTVLKFEDYQQNVISTITNFAIHPEALGGSNTFISADLVNYLHKGIESNTGGISIFLNGGLGGMVTPMVKEHTFEEAKRIGLEISAYALRALETARTISLDKLEVRSSEINVRLENERFLKASEVGVISRKMNDNFVASEVELVRLGNAVGLITIPGEPLPRISLELKSLMPFKYKLVASLTNDELGYIIPEDEWNPEKYEESMSVSQGIAPIVESKIEELLLSSNS